MARNNNNVEGAHGGVYDEIPDYFDLERERERVRELSPSKRQKQFKDIFSKEKEEDK